jgi:hypothetical protein
MTVVRVEANVSTEQLLQAVKQLPTDELATFVAQVLALRAQREAPPVTRAESELLLRVNQGIPADLQQRYEDLIAKRRSETLTLEEHTELLALTDQVEQLEADRIAALAELARLRHISVTDLMRDLGIQPRYG